MKISMSDWEKFLTKASFRLECNRNLGNNNLDFRTKIGHELNGDKQVACELRDTFRVNRNRSDHITRWSLIEFSELFEKSESRRLNGKMWVQKKLTWRFF